MRLNKYWSKLNGRLDYLWGLIIVLSLAGMAANAQSDVISTNSNNDEEKRIDDKFHACTRRNRGNHEEIQICIKTAMDEKRQLAKQRNNDSEIKIADNSGYKKGNINTDVIQTNGDGNRPKSQPPPYIDDYSQIPQSAPQQKRKPIKGRTNTNISRTNQPPPKTGKTDNPQNVPPIITGRTSANQPTEITAKTRTDLGKLLRTDVWVGEGTVEYQNGSGNFFQLPYQVVLKDYVYEKGVSYAANEPEISKNNSIAKNDNPIATRVQGQRTQKWQRTQPGSLYVLGVYVKASGILTREDKEQMMMVNDTINLKKVGSIPAKP